MAWTISTKEFFGERNAMASRPGTSTPSDRHFALDRMRHSVLPGSLPRRSQSSSFPRTRAFIVPSTWWTAAGRSPSVPANVSTSLLKPRVKVLESRIEDENATAERMGARSDPRCSMSAATSFLLNAFQQPIHLPTSSTLSMVPSPS